MIERYGYDGRGVTIRNNTGSATWTLPSMILEGQSIELLIEQMRDSRHINSEHIPEPKLASIPQPTRIIFHDPATIVFWDDGTKTVVKCMKGTAFSAYYGFLCALGKKIYGSNRAIEKMVWEGEVQL